MPWKIREFLFSQETQSLVSNERSQPIEPLMAEVLGYFCRHPNETISRDQLIAEVWQSRVVTDNAVNRVVSRLRQLLGDDPREPRFIATLPKKGYRFVAPVEWVDEAVQDRAGGLRPLIAPTAIALGAVLAALLWLLRGPEPSPESSVIALTRGGAQEYGPAVAPGARLLAYSSFVGDQLQLFLKDLDSQETVRISTGEGSSGGASWSFDGRSLVYLYTEEGVCQFHLASVDGLIITGRRVIHNCPPGSYGGMQFTHDPNRLVYSEAPGQNQPYALFELNLESARKRRLPQPEIHLGGNSEFDVHPARDQLLIASPDAEQWLSFYRLDLASDDLSLLFRLDEFVCCPVWDHRGERIVVMGEHPAYTLVSFDLKGRDRRVIHRAPHRISWLARHPRAPHFVYAGGIYNRDIVVLDLTDLSRRTLVDSSVDDRLASLSPDGRRLAYLSERSGTDEIWLLNLGDGSSRPLGSTIAGDPYYYDLQWSPAGDRLLALSINEIHVLAERGGPVEKLKIPQQEIRAVSWKDPGTVAFSLRRGDAFRVYSYDLAADALTPVAAESRYIRYETDPQDTLWISDAGELAWGPDQRPLQVAVDNPIVRRRFGVQKRGDTLYFLALRNHRWSLNALTLADDGASGEPRVLFEEQTPGRYSLGRGEIYFSTLASHSADIYLTQ